ncbi:MAG: nucleotidyltransferase domain-containing protein [Candidatus Saccharibacteria bacterium]|nr:nucleotidyltransferase domain-containing protein [Candidatus Saccharibacteria bacterium]
MYTIENIKQKLSPVFRGYNVSYALLFGSYAKGVATEKSDIDLYVDSGLKGMKFVGLIEAIRDALGDREVDVLDVAHVDNDSGVFKEIQRTGVKIYG